ncbi:hypothetical protein ElyMa_003712100 [Elysia marginata]|uniref:Spaetzle domain-containing protein n=1 Tax=Elysia marginata TaxID=1093978 RepID=A0AAV4F323_9GAST|nr:hypothetical protein ElyMa_003712100 [Elysia marginata]
MVNIKSNDNGSGSRRRYLKASGEISRQKTTRKIVLDSSVIKSRKYVHRPDSARKYPASEGLVVTLISPANITMGKDCPSSRTWMILAIIFIAISVGLSIYLIVDKVKDNDDSDKQLTKSSSDDEIYAAYPSFFRTEDEQKKFEEDHQMLINMDIKKAPVGLPYAANNCSYECVNETSLGPSSSYVYHACCRSVAVHRILKTALTTKNVLVTVVQLVNKKQRILFEECWHMANCAGCTCGNTQTYVQAIVYLPNGIITLENIRVPGCCKCFNNI